MTQNQKPEWLELADNDNRPALRKVSKGLPILAFMASISIIGAGTIFAQPQNFAPIKSDSNIMVTQTAQETPTPNSAARVTVDSSAASVDNQSVLPTSITTPVTFKTNKAMTNIINPLIGIIPTGGGDDDNDNEDESEDDESEDDESDDNEGDD